MIEQKKTDIRNTLKDNLMTGLLGMHRKRESIKKMLNKLTEVIRSSKEWNIPGSFFALKERLEAYSTLHEEYPVIPYSKLKSMSSDLYLQENQFPQFNQFIEHLYPIQKFDDISGGEWIILDVSWLINEIINFLDNIPFRNEISSIDSLIYNQKNLYSQNFFPIALDYMSVKKLGLIYPVSTQQNTQKTPRKSKNFDTREVWSSFSINSKLDSFVTKKIESFFLPDFFPLKEPQVSLEDLFLDSVNNMEYQRFYYLKNAINSSILWDILTQFIQMKWNVKSVWIRGYILEKNGECIIIKMLQVNELELHCFINNEQNLILIFDGLDILLRESYKQTDFVVEVVCTHCIFNVERDKRRVNSKTLRKPKLIGIKQEKPSVFLLSNIIESASKGVFYLECKTVNPVSIHLLAPEISMKKSKKLLVENEKLIVGEKIGQGGYANVFKGILIDPETKNQTVVAIKQIEVDLENVSEENSNESNDLKKLNAFNDFRREATLMSEIEHPNLVKMMGITLHPFRLILEYMDSGDLYQYIHNEKNFLGPLEIIGFAVDMAQGMTFLHGYTPKIIHRDLKSPNVIFIFLQPFFIYFC